MAIEGGDEAVIGKGGLFLFEIGGGQLHIFFQLIHILF